MRQVFGLKNLFSPWYGPASFALERFFKSVDQAAVTSDIAGYGGGFIPWGGFQTYGACDMGFGRAGCELGALHGAGFYVVC